MKDQINFREELLNLKKEINELKLENNNLKQKIKEQSLEIKNLKEEHNKDKNFMFSEIEKLKQNMNTIKEINTDNAPPLSNSPFITPFSSKNDDTLTKIQETEKGEYITSISFFLSNSIDLSMAQLLYYGYEPVEGNIRKGSGGKYCILGCKYEKNQPYITNIIGSVSDKEEPVIIYENEIKYNAVKDPLNNADIHKGSGGNFLCFYFTKDTKAGKPIKSLRTLSTEEILKDPNIIKYCTRKTKYNKPFEPLDCNRGRGNIITKKTPQNYIFIERE